MKLTFSIARFVVLAFLSSAGCVTSVLAEEVSIPDLALNADVRQALQKPVGPLTVEDVLTLTNLDACCGNIRSIAGLEAARNLIDLDLEGNLLGSFNYPSNWANVRTLNLSASQVVGVVEE